MIIYIASEVAELLTHLSTARLEVGIALSLFGVSLAYLFWHASRHSTLVLTDEYFFVYPLTLRWRDIRTIEQRRWGVWVRTRPGTDHGTQDLPIFRAFFALTPPDVALMQTLQSRAA